MPGPHSSLRAVGGRIASSQAGPQAASCSPLKWCRHTLPTGLTGPERARYFFVPLPAVPAIWPTSETPRKSVVGCAKAPAQVMAMDAPALRAVRTIRVRCGGEAVVRTLRLVHPTAQLTP